MTSVPPSELNKYQFIHELGKGQYSFVYEIKNKETPENRVIKLMKLKYSSPEKTQAYHKRCHKEIEILKKIDHPNVIKLEDYFIPPCRELLKRRHSDKEVVTVVISGIGEEWTDKKPLPKRPRDNNNKQLQLSKINSIANANNTNANAFETTRTDKKMKFPDNYEHATKHKYSIENDKENQQTQQSQNCLSKANYTQVGRRIVVNHPKPRLISEDRKFDLKCNWGHLYFSHLPGATNLKEWIRKKQLYAVQFKRATSFYVQHCKIIITELTKGVNYLHSSLKIVHRDIKLDNIIVKESHLNDGEKRIDNVKLIDLGFAKNFSELPKIINTTMIPEVAGSFCYKAPELVTPQVYYYNYKIDIWCLGLVLRLLLSRKETLFSFKNTELEHKSTEELKVWTKCQIHNKNYSAKYEKSIDLFEERNESDLSVYLNDSFNESFELYETLKRLNEEFILEVDYQKRLDGKEILGKLSEIKNVSSF